jgi:L-rhamnose mutarotase
MRVWSEMHDMLTKLFREQYNCDLPPPLCDRCLDVHNRAQDVKMRKENEEDRRMWERCKDIPLDISNAKEIARFSERFHAPQVYLDMKMRSDARRARRSRSREEMEY